MRPIEDVLGAARNQSERISYCDCQKCIKLRRELEEWEAKLAADVVGVVATSSYADATKDPRYPTQLAEIRRLLGRTEPEPTGWPVTRNVMIDVPMTLSTHTEKVVMETVKQREISQATARRLMEACEALCQAQEFYAYHASDNFPGNKFYQNKFMEVVNMANDARKQARTELAGEATNASVRHTDV